MFIIHPTLKCFIAVLFIYLSFFGVYRKLLLSFYILGLVWYNDLRRYRIWICLTYVNLFRICDFVNDDQWERFIYSFNHNLTRVQKVPKTVRFIVLIWSENIPIGYATYYLNLIYLNILLADPEELMLNCHQQCI